MQPLLVGIALFALSAVVQSTAVAASVSLMEAIIRRGHAQGSFWNITFVLQLFVFLLLGAHMIQIGLWALLFVLCGQFRSFSAAFSHSAVNYTTLGYGDVVPLERWRLIGPMTAMNGVLLFGWSTAVIFEVLRRTLARTLEISPH